ncbi:MAG TPA: FHA domain-containing serine/threonine-protein kinase [Trebonia sp.]|nr:FHA domain-containing serine/threonine-protein kinase [Trebonia sp.]
MNGDSAAQLGGPLTGLRPGSRVAGYLLADLVGVGGMAVVFRAHDEGLGRTVALKVLAGNLAGDQAARERFAREARTVANVEHPHIIPVYAAGQADGLLYIAMRFVDGADLHALIHSDGPLPPRRAAAFVSDMASALDAAHAVGVVHRDVKPANVLVDSRPGRPEHGYLTDFGVARVSRSTGGLTIAGQFIGTPNYGAPEQISGGQVDGRTDQYALACVAYELLTGSVPFKREDPMMVLYAHAYADPPVLTAARPDLPAAVDAVLARGLAKQPDQRYGTCADFADALREALGLEHYDPRRSDGSGRTRIMTPPQAPPQAPPPAKTKTMTIPELPGPRPPAHNSSAPNAPVPTASAGTWTAVVTGDRGYYEHVHAADAADAASISFPAYVAERRFPLSGTEVRIGRRSTKNAHQPDIDLTGPPTDPGVSRQHAELRRAPDGTWSVIDLDSPNGIQVNSKDVPAGTPIPLLPGDQIHLGAWTLITLTRTA